jgi:hypothetical protein
LEGKTMDRKTILTAGVFGGIGVYIIPTFVKSLIDYKPVFVALGITIMAIAVVYFIAYEQINKLLGKSSGYNKEISKQLKQGKITPQKAFELEKQKLEHELILEKQRFELAKQKAEIAKLKQASGSGFSLGGGGSTKMPDVLGNMGAVIRGDESSKKEEKKNNIDNLKDLF